jgi:glucose-1-phosphate thymidylyltransferase
VACLEEIAFSNGWIQATQVAAMAEKYGKTEYGVYLQRLIQDGNPHA